MRTFQARIHCSTPFAINTLLNGKDTIPPVSINHDVNIFVVLVLVVLAAHYVSVSVPVLLLKLFRHFTPNVVTLLTWGGLRGGVSIAVTYIIVIFLVLVQGLTLSQANKNKAID
ncbi:MAG: hypothetical protein COB61_001685 [Thiotrichales bacterium]|nr:hypothetical protein [Thiotrichales bacterium]